MSTHQIFKLESRPYGDAGHTTMALIECSRCPARLWKRSPDSGRATMLFRTAGWFVGSHRNKDLCPSCRRKRGH